MSMTVDALLRAVLTYNLYGQNMQNVFWFRTKPGAIPYDHPFDVTEWMANDIYNWIVQPSLDIMSNEVSYVGHTVTWLTPEPGVFSLRVYDLVNGHDIGTAEPTTIAGVISYHTRFIGRRTHGRTYLGGISHLFREGNEFNGSGRTTMQHIADQYKSRYGIDGSSNACNMVVFSKANGATIIPLPTPHYSYLVEAGIPITDFTPRRVLFTQRHRLAGRGI